MYMDNQEIDQIMKTIAKSMAMKMSRSERREKAAYWHGYLNALTEQYVLSEKDRGEILYWMTGFKKREHWQRAANQEYLLFHYHARCNAVPGQDARNIANEVEKRLDKKFSKDRQRAYPTNIFGDDRG